jgi:hypothetical protein
LVEVGHLDGPLVRQMGLLVIGVVLFDCHVLSLDVELAVIAWMVEGSGVRLKVVEDVRVLGRLDFFLRVCFPVPHVFEIG